jgi:hypothetical protein
MTKALEIKQTMLRSLHRVVMRARKVKNRRNAVKITRMNHKSQLPSRNCVNGRARFARKKLSTVYSARRRPSQ